MFNWYFNLLESMSYSLFAVMGIPAFIGIAITFVTVKIHDFIKK